MKRADRINPVGSFCFPIHFRRSAVIRTSSIWLVLAILCLAPLGCGGADKGKNKDLDRPKSTEAK